MQNSGSPRQFRASEKCRPQAGITEHVTSECPNRDHQLASRTKLSWVRRARQRAPGWLQDVVAELRLPPSPDQGRRRLTRLTRSSHSHQGGQLSDFDASSGLMDRGPGNRAALGRAAKAPAVAAGARGDGRLVPRWGEKLERATRGSPRCPPERQRTKAPGSGFPVMHSPGRCILSGDTATVYRRLARQRGTPQGGPRYTRYGHASRIGRLSEIAFSLNLFCHKRDISTLRRSNRVPSYPQYRTGIARAQIPGAAGAAPTGCRA